MNKYAPTVTPWQVEASDYPQDGALADRLRFLLRYAALAPSSHNTEPWRFAVTPERIDLFMDEARWLKVADDDQRELHISVGCALENLLVAAEHFGLGHGVQYLPDNGKDLLAACVTFSETGQTSSFRPPVLFEMLTVRHTNHQAYDHRSIPHDVLDRLQNLSDEDGLHLFLTDDLDTKRQVDELVTRADAIEFADPAFRDELAHWIGRGVFGTSWLMSKLGQLAVSHLNLGKSQAKTDSEMLMSSPVLGLICTESDDRVSQIKVGQVYERLSLLAASHGIWTQPMSQIVQIPELKQELRTLIPTPNLTPQHPFRIGFAEPEDRRTPRRPLEEMLL